MHGYSSGVTLLKDSFPELDGYYSKTVVPFGPLFNTISNYKLCHLDNCIKAFTRLKKKLNQPTFTLQCATCFYQPYHCAYFHVIYIYRSLVNSILYLTILQFF